jgi:hypothetical protein
MSPGGAAYLVGPLPKRIWKETESKRDQEESNWLGEKCRS